MYFISDYGRIVKFKEQNKETKNNLKRNLLIGTGLVGLGAAGFIGNKIYKSKNKSFNRKDYLAFFNTETITQQQQPVKTKDQIKKEKKRRTLRNIGKVLTVASYPAGVGLAAAANYNYLSKADKYANDPEKYNRLVRRTALANMVGGTGALTGTVGGGITWARNSRRPGEL